MTAAEILQKLDSAGVSLSVVGGSLKFKASRGAYTPELREIVAENRDAIVAALASPISQGVDQTLPVLTPTDRQALHAELVALVDRWRRGLEVERQGWRSPDHAEQAYLVFVEMAGREQAIRAQLGEAADDVPELATLRLDGEPVAEEVNPLREHMNKAGAWVGVGERFGWEVADHLFALAADWWRSPAERRAELAEQYKAAWSAAKAAHAAKEQR